MSIGFAGTLDPMTNGHLWVINEARKFNQGVTIMLPENPTKKPTVPVERRQQIVNEVINLHNWCDVDVHIIRKDYTARAAKKLGVERLIRGIRSSGEFDYEHQLHTANVDEVGGVPTFFVLPPPNMAKISSSYVKSFAANSPVGWHWIVQDLMPAPAYNEMRDQWLRAQWADLWNYDTKDLLMRRDYEHQYRYLTSSGGYDMPARQYHDLNHIVHGLNELDAWFEHTGGDLGNVYKKDIAANTSDLKILKLAMFYHDLVYTTQKGGESDEEASAKIMDDLSIAPLLFRNSAAALIRATDHLQANSIVHPLKDVMLGADLAILGQPQKVYDAYTQGIRYEYQRFSDAEYYDGRIKALTYLRDKAIECKLFRHCYFHEQYNEAAIDNMSREIAQINISKRNQ